MYFLGQLLYKEALYYTSKEVQVRSLWKCSILRYISHTHILYKQFCFTCLYSGQLRAIKHWTKCPLLWSGKHYQVINNVIDNEKDSWHNILRLSLSMDLISGSCLLTIKVHNQSIW